MSRDTRTSSLDRSEYKRLWQQAEAHAARRQWDAAIAAFEKLLARAPRDARVLLQLSYTHSLAGHYRMAREHALRAARAKPREADVLRELLGRLRTFNLIEELNACIDRMRPLASMPIPLLLSGASQYSNLGVQGRALELLDEAKRGDPAFPPTLLARAQVLMYLGRFDEAHKEALTATKRAPDIAQGWWLLSRLRKQAPDDNHVDAIRAQLGSGQRKPLEIAMLAEALHKELDDLGRYDEAWSALETMCRAKRTTLDYKPAQAQDLIDRLIAMPVLAPVSPPPSSTRTPIFIVGMHRSGTTLLEQLLDGHSQVRGVGELYDFTSCMRYATDHHCRGPIDATIVERAPQSDFAEVGAGYLAGMEWRLGTEPCFTDKLPSNFLNIGFICRALPQAKILHMVRDPVETCFSNLRELFSDANPYSYDQLELAHYARQYQRLMAHWHAAYPGRILDVDYAELTRDTEKVLRRVSDFCGLSFEPHMLDIGKRDRGVATASAVQVREGVVARETPKWAPYETWLQPMIQALRAP